MCGVVVVVVVEGVVGREKRGMGRVREVVLVGRLYDE